MKIAIPVMDLHHNKFMIANSLSVLGYLCIYDMVKDGLKWKQTLDYASSMGELLPALEKQDVSVFIVKNILPMALKVLLNKGFIVYKAKGDNLETNISFSVNGNLDFYDYEQALVDKISCGGTTCGSCSLDCN
jgi:predicted Fe-Mo cluster-binding NifX family protein